MSPNELRRLLAEQGMGADGMALPQEAQQPQENVLAQYLAMAQPDTQAMIGKVGMPQIATSEQEAFANLPREQQDTGQLPMGSFRNNTTGRTQYFGPQGPRDAPYGGDELAAAQQQQQPQKQRIKVMGFGNDGIMSDLGETDAAVPLMDNSRGYIETPFGKGMYGKDGKVYVKGQDGAVTQIRQGYDRDASYLAQKRDFERRKGEAELVQTGAQTEQTMEATAATRAARNVREDPNSQKLLEQKYGQPNKGFRWRPDGTPEPVPGQKEDSAKDVLGLLSEAEPLLRNPDMTGSGSGALMDKGAAFFGKATEGAKLTGQLKTIAGLLVSKMPRMEGPQSNFDVQNYQEMAGQLADPSLPVETRLAALKQIRALNEKYATGTMGQTPGTAPGAPRSFVPPAGQVDRSRAIAEAQFALGKGVPREKVRERLAQLGVSNSGI